MIVEVTSQDIDTSRFLEGTDEYRPHCDCPIARALLRALKLERNQITVSPGMAIAGGRRITFPAPVHGWVSNFDSGDAVMPFTFEIEV